METNLISAACKSRKAYEVISKHPIDWTDKSKIIFDAIGTYYKRDEDINSIDKELLGNQLSRKYPKHEDTFKTAIKCLPDVNGISVENILEEILEVKRESVSLELSQAFASRSQKRIQELLPVWEQLEEGHPEEREEGVEVFYQQPIAGLVKTHKDNVDRIAFAPRPLNEFLDGGCSKQDHVVIFGRPEIGKSTFILNLVYGFCHQKKKVLLINNEDAPMKLLLRFYQRATGWTRAQIEADPEGAHEVMDRTGVYEHLVLVAVPDGTIGEIEDLVREHKPDVLVVDQLRNIHMAGENRVLQLEIITRELRKLGRKYNLLTVSTTQAGDSAQGKKVLELGDIDWSNTGVQGACDLMIGIGADEVMRERSSRMLSFPKNKISARRDPLLVEFDVVNCRVK